MNSKRLFDVILSSVGLLVLSPVLVIVSSGILLESGRPIIYRQKRVGKDWEQFTLFKFRSMVSQEAIKGPICNIKNDKRVTTLGKFLRKYKLDEIPQLFNVLKGDMSVVGPRPEVPEFVAYYPDSYREILKIKPGITDLASIEFRDESSLLDCEADEAENVYLTKILPQKLSYNRIYLNKMGFVYDIKLIIKTVYSIILK